jgi:hypothetical protein
MIIPQPDDQVSFQVDGREWLRYHYGEQAPKPYFYPLMGPAGAPVTRLTHPHDPFTHNHHLSLWIGHEKVGGTSFWGPDPEPRAHRVRPHQDDRGRGPRLAHDPGPVARRGQKAAAARREGLDAEPALRHDRVDGFGEYTLDLQLKLTPVAPIADAGKTNFGLVAVRWPR